MIGDAIMSKKTCFVVSAIGEEKSAIREHSDSVLEYIIKPALSDKYEVKRADELYHSDKIDEKIFDALSKSDLVIVDITSAIIAAITVALGWVNQGSFFPCLRFSISFFLLSI